MTDAKPEDELVEDVEPQLDDPDPEEYEAEGEDAVSGDTGTVYEGRDGEQEPAVTPHDTTLGESDEDSAG